MSTAAASGGGGDGDGTRADAVIMGDCEARELATGAGGDTVIATASRSGSAVATCSWAPRCAADIMPTRR